MDRARRKQLKRAAKLLYWYERRIPDASVELVDIPCLMGGESHVGFRVHLGDIEGAWIAGAACEGEWIVSNWINPTWARYGMSVANEQLDSGNLIGLVARTREIIYGAARDQGSIA
jgi:hypothetical protein